MSFGFYFHSFKGEDNCIVLNAKKIAAMPLRRDYLIQRNEEDASEVFIVPEGDAMEGYTVSIFIEEEDFKEMYRLSNLLLSREPSHIYFENDKISCILSCNEYDWM